LQYHDARYLCGVKGRSDWTMATFISSMRLQYHSSPVKQRAVRNKSKGGAATPGAFPSFTDEKSPGTLAFPRPLYN